MISQTGFKVQSYFENLNLSYKEKQLLFRLRTRMTDVKSNLKSMHSDISCNFCDNSEPQTDSHLLDCHYFIDACPQLNDDNSVEHEDIFMNIDAQVRVTKIYKHIFEIKAKQEEDQEDKQIDDDDINIY